jgi:hypothetical protein
MSLTAREYLVDRFTNDARVLRERVETLARGAKVPGPDAATSRSMAAACDEVAAMVQAVADTGNAAYTLDALVALIPLLEQRAGVQASPAVRSVYAGAATRLREVHAAERQADADDADFDDSELDDDDLPEPDRDDAARR